MTMTNRRRFAVSVALAAVLVAAGCSGSGTTTAETYASAVETDAAAAADVAEPTLTPVAGAVHYSPIPFMASDGNRHLVYELMLTNYFTAPVTVSTVDVLDAGTGMAVAGIDATVPELQPSQHSNQMVLDQSIVTFSG
jgi:hypothetical protein